MEWNLVSPISYKPTHGLQDGIHLPYTWDEKVTLMPNPEWVRDSETLKLMSTWQRERALEGELALVANYVPKEASFQPDLQEAEEWILFVALAVWIVRPCDFTYEFVFKRSVDMTGNVAKNIAQVARTYVDSSDADAVLRQIDLEASLPLFKRICELSRNGVTWVSLFAMWRGLSEKQIEFRTVLFWIALEALFGATQPGESTHKIAERMAIFLEKQPSKRLAMFKAVKDAYSLRSTVVHGMRSKKKNSIEKDIKRLYLTQEWLRRSLQKILTDDGLLSQFESENRDEFLNKLVLT